MAFPFSPYLCSLGTKKIRYRGISVRGRPSIIIWPHILPPTPSGKDFPANLSGRGVGWSAMMALTFNPYLSSLRAKKIRYMILAMKGAPTSSYGHTSPTPNTLKEGFPRKSFRKRAGPNGPSHQPLSEHHKGSEDKVQGYGCQEPPLHHLLATHFPPQPPSGKDFPANL